MELRQTQSYQCMRAWFHIPFYNCQHVYCREMIFMWLLNAFWVLILDIVRMKLKSLIFECINVANISSITDFMLLLDIMCNEIEVLIFCHEGMFCIHCWNKFLYIIEAYFYILLEQLSVHFYSIIHCRSIFLCIVRTLTYNVLTIICALLHNYTLLEHTFYALLDNFDIHSWNNYLYTST
jgi:hypothetical protein